MLYPIYSVTPLPPRKLQWTANTQEISPDLIHVHPSLVLKTKSATIKHVSKLHISLI